MKKRRVRSEVKGVLKDKVAGHETVNIKELVREHSWRWRGQWTDEDNFLHRIRGVFRDALNDLKYNSVGGGVYFDMENGKDENMRALAMNRLESSLAAKMTAFIERRRQRTGTIAGQYVFQVDETGRVHYLEET